MGELVQMELPMNDTIHPAVLDVLWGGVQSQWETLGKPVEAPAATERIRWPDWMARPMTSSSIWVPLRSGENWLTPVQVTARCPEVFGAPGDTMLSSLASAVRLVSIENQHWYRFASQFDVTEDSVAKAEGEGEGEALVTHRYRSADSEVDVSVSISRPVFDAGGQMWQCGYSIQGVERRGPGPTSMSALISAVAGLSAAIRHVAESRVG